MRNYLCCFVVVFVVSACATYPRAQYNYTGSIPPNIEFDAFSVAREFSEALAASADLKIVDGTRPTGHPGYDTKAIVNVRSLSQERIYVTIVVSASTRSLDVIIAGDVRSSNVKAVGLAAERIFADKYNGEKLIPYTNFQGLFGP